MTNMPDSELKPCPFCGNIPEISISGLYYFIKCYSPCHMCSVRTIYFDSQDKAISSWNTRTRPSDESKKEETMKPEYYYKGSRTTYKEGVDPEVTCWHCKKTFLCDCCDATCRLCGAPYAKERCKEFNFTPKPVDESKCEHKGLEPDGICYDCNSAVDMNKPSSTTSEVEELALIVRRTRVRTPGRDIEDNDRKAAMEIIKAGYRKS